MTQKPDIPAISHHMLMLICDGSRSLIARNTGTASHVRIEVMLTRVARENPQSSLRGDDRPGRVVTGDGTRRSSVEAPDLHDRDEVEFLNESVKAFCRMAEQEPASPLAVIAPPPALATIRLGLERYCGKRDVVQIPVVSQFEI